MEHVFHSQHGKLGSGAKPGVLAEDTGAVDKEERFAVVRSPRFFPYGIDPSDHVPQQDRVVRDGLFVCPDEGSGIGKADVAQQYVAGRVDQVKLFFGFQSDDF